MLSLRVHSLLTGGGVGVCVHAGCLLRVGTASAHSLKCGFAMAHACRTTNLKWCFSTPPTSPGKNPAVLRLLLCITHTLSHSSTTGTAFLSLLTATLLPACPHPHTLRITTQLLNTLETALILCCKCWKYVMEHPQLVPPIVSLYTLF